jgi:hypothetical protein
VLKTRLNLIMRVAMTTLTTLAFGAIAATAAQAATEGPFWTVEGKRLETNETREITIHAVGSVTMEAELLTIKAKVTCSQMRVAKGSYLAGGVPGTGRAIVEYYGGCSVVNNGSACHVEEPIRTEPMRGELVVSDSVPGFGPYVLGEAKPESGTKIVEIGFTGNCTVTSTELTGEPVGMSFTDPVVDSGKEEQITTGNVGSISLTSYLGRPFVASSVWLFKGRTFELVEPKQLEAFGNPAKEIGTILSALVNGKRYGAGL